jgi:hypothetical protein
MVMVIKVIRVFIIVGRLTRVVRVILVPLGLVWRQCDISSPVITLQPTFYPR